MLKVSAKLHTIRSKIISLSGKSYPYYFIIAAIIAAFYNVFFILLVLLLLYKFKRKYKVKILLIFLLIIAASFSLNFISASKKPKEEIKGVVVEVYNNKNNLVIKSKNINYLVKTQNKYSVGDILMVTGQIQKPRGVRVPHGFNLRKYYLSKNIYYEINQPEIDKIGFNYIYYPQKLIAKYLDYFPKLTQTYLRSMILGINEHELEFKQSTNLLQISYLINLSGVLVYTVISIFKKIFYYLDIETSHQEKIIITLLFLWSYVTGFKLVMLRILIMSLISYINRVWNLKLTRLDIIFYTFFNIIIINPNFINSIGFSLGFIVITTINLITPEIKISNSIIKRYVLFFMVYLSIFPILINSLNIIYLLMFIITPILVVLYRKGVVYLFLIVIVLPLLSDFVEFILHNFEVMITYLSSFDLRITFPSFNNFLMFIYYIIVIFFFINKKLINKHLLSLFILLFITYNKAYFNPTYKLYFLDVDQGDTTILITPHYEDVIVIDAYGDVVNVLRKMGIRKINYLILTHPDYDHIREASNLITNFDVKNILINPYDDYKFDGYHPIKIKSGDTIFSNNYKITFYSPYKNNLNTNDNSLVFKLEYLNNQVLFLGDISKKIEIDLVNRYGDELKSNILKLAHHGSNTSTSSILLNTVKPDDVIISAGFNNIYGFPHQEVMENLGDKYQIYRTDLDHTIVYTNRFNYAKTTKYYQNYIIYYIIKEIRKGRFYGQFNLFILWCK
ncbi:MAG: ComEC/Rec2 family competence protein [Acholeplasmataceae bacterium]